MGSTSTSERAIARVFFFFFFFFSHSNIVHGGGGGGGRVLTRVEQTHVVILLQWDILRTLAMHIGQEELVSCSSDYYTRWLAIK
jgi:hypothetical protein